MNGISFNVKHLNHLLVIEQFYTLQNKTITQIELA